MQNDANIDAAVNLFFESESWSRLDKYTFRYERKRRKIKISFQTIRAAKSVQKTFLANFGFCSRSLGTLLN